MSESPCTLTIWDSNFWSFDASNYYWPRTASAPNGPASEIRTWIPSRLLWELSIRTLAAMKPILRAVQMVKRRLERRDEPRWGSARWKAKT